MAYIEPLEILASILRAKLEAGKPVNSLLLRLMDELTPGWRENLNVKYGD